LFDHLQKYLANFREKQFALDGVRPGGANTDRESLLLPDQLCRVRRHPGFRDARLGVSMEFNVLFDTLLKGFQSQLILGVQGGDCQR
jgi:hypothetical protein